MCHCPKCPALEVPAPSFLAPWTGATTAAHRCRLPDACPRIRRCSVHQHIPIHSSCPLYSYSKWTIKILPEATSGWISHRSFCPKIGTSSSTSPPENHGLGGCPAKLPVPIGDWRVACTDCTICISNMRITSKKNIYIITLWNEREVLELHRKWYWIRIRLDCSINVWVNLMEWNINSQQNDEDQI
jgi:hypothetical protein